MTQANTYTIRRATSDDAAALTRLAQLDTGRALEGRVLLAERDGELVAALSLDDRRALSSPFHVSAPALIVLRARAGALAAEQRRSRPRLGERLRGGARLPRSGFGTA